MCSNTLQNTFSWFQKAVPEPEAKNQTTQLGVHIEEVAEMLKELSATESGTKELLDSAILVMEQLATKIKKDGAVVVHQQRKHDFLDALCDQIVTATGVARMHGFDLIGAMDEVNRSNFSKFVDGAPVFDENRKIRKGPGYSKADLYPYL